MLTEGDIVEVEMIHAEVYGVYCKYHDLDVLLLIPEISWVSSFCSCEQFIVKNKKITVKIRIANPDENTYSATIQGLYPNPWGSDKLNVGEKYSAEVIRYVEKSDRCADKPAYLLELFPGSYAMLAKEDFVLKDGQLVNVIIEESDPKNHSLKLSFDYAGS